MRCNWGLVIAFALVVGAGVCISRLWESPRAAHGLPQAVYIWQRDWGGAVQEGLREVDEDFASVVVLVAEVAWKDGAFVAARVRPDYLALKQTGRPIGLAIRVGSYGGGFGKDEAACGALVELVREVEREAVEAGCDPVEIQLDFDCATSKLVGYRQWVEAVAAAVEPVPIAITALPTWLDSAEFAPLARAAGRFILQVHSLERPRVGDTELRLCDVRTARRWVEQAAEVGVPFRVALPTYGYLAAFQEDGKLLGVIAEAEAPEWVGGATMRAFRADPAEMAGLVRTWMGDRPLLMTGVIWYRMPVATDRLNWSWPTLQSVMRAEIPRSHLLVRAVQRESGLVEIVATNEGDADGVLSGVMVKYAAGSLLAADAVGGMEIESESERHTTLVRLKTPLNEAIRPNEERVVAWLRFVDGTEVDVDASIQSR